MALLILKYNLIFRNSLYIKTNFKKKTIFQKKKKVLGEDAMREIIS
jgi:hypothetical protein